MTTNKYRILDDKGNLIDEESDLVAVIQKSTMLARTRQKPITVIKETQEFVTTIHPEEVLDND